MRACQGPNAVLGTFEIEIKRTFLLMINKNAIELGKDAHGLYAAYQRVEAIFGERIEVKSHSRS
eukprot:6187648-Pleurochrysis_carterae.AAC.3